MKVNRDKFRVDNETGFGTVQFHPEDEDDLYQLYMLISKGDLCKIENDRRGDFDIQAEESAFDSFLLTVKGKVSTGDRHYQPGTYRTLTVDKNTGVTFTKKKWDYFDVRFLDRAEFRASISPIGIVSLRSGVGEIHLIGDGWTRTLISIHDENETKLFARLLRNFDANKIDIMRVAHIFLVSDGAIQPKFYEYIFKNISPDKKKLFELYKYKVCTLDIPMVVESRENLKRALLHPIVKRKTAQEIRQSLLEVESLDRYEKKAREKPNAVCNDKAQVMRMVDNITELLVFDENLRNGERSLYWGMLKAMQQRHAKVTYFSSHNFWYTDLGGDRVAAIFDGNEDTLKD